MYHEMRLLSGTVLLLNFTTFQLYVINLGGSTMYMVHNTFYIVPFRWQIGVRVQN